MKKVLVLGAGSWGTALAVILEENGHEVWVWGRDKNLIEAIKVKRENARYLKGIELSNNINFIDDYSDLIGNFQYIVLAIPTQSIRNVVKEIKPLLKEGAILINTAKGLEDESLLRLSQVISEEVGTSAKVAVLSGPSHAEEVAKLLPTTVVASAEDSTVAEEVQDLFMSSCFRVYANPDLIGVEIGGALKNIIALATGISDGLGLGDNTRAAIMTRGLSEIVRLGHSLGASQETFAGLTGIGDLIVTCNSMHSRNRRGGILIGEGYSIEEMQAKVGMVVEGINTTRVALKLAQKQKIHMPITEEVFNIVYKGKDPKESVATLMERQKKLETEELPRFN